MGYFCLIDTVHRIAEAAQRKLRIPDGQIVVLLSRTEVARTLRFARKFRLVGAEVQDEQTTAVSSVRCLTGPTNSYIHNGMSRAGNPAMERLEHQTDTRVWGTADDISEEVMVISLLLSSTLILLLNVR